MKTFLKVLCRCRIAIINLVLIACILSLNDAVAQGKKSIAGRLSDAKSGQFVSYATIALINAADSTISGGAMSDENGRFNIGPVIPGSYLLRVSNIGYKPAGKFIEVAGEGVTDAGTIILQDTSIMLQELVVTAERVKAKTEKDRIIYNVTEKMLNASATGTDILKLIPGVQVDMMQNISLEGSHSIMIYVDGKERDNGYVNQLNPEDIDKIEVVSIPPSEFDGNVTGALNIIMKKSRDSGIKGQVLAEIPTSRSVVYIFPSYNLSYSFRKVNLYTSYNGEMTFLDQEENFLKEFNRNSDTTRVLTQQTVRQKNRSDRFHYGLDYFLNDRNQLNFYAYYNPYSQELDGKVFSQISGGTDSLWQAGKDDSDKNRSSFYSLYYKHTFSDNGYITADVSSYMLRAETSTIYFSDEPGENIQKKNDIKPSQDLLSVKIDYFKHLFGKIDFSSGLKMRFQVSKDRLSTFEYHENILAFYTSVNYKLKNFDLTGGIRFEESTADLKDGFSGSDLAFFPHASARYRISSRQYLQLTYNRSIKRPNLNQLNPYTNFNDPWSTSSGNPYLRPEYLGSLILQHSLQFNGNYIASRVFYSRADDVISNLTRVNGSGIFEAGYHNPGYMTQYGTQVSGSFKTGFLTLNPFIKAYMLHTFGNEIAREYNIKDRVKPGLESGFSAIASFKHGLAFSMNIQYNTSQYDIQSRYFTDITYFLTLEKSIRDKFKVGLASAIPFTHSFTYNGSETCALDFNATYEGKVIMSKIPVWFRLGYQFSSGKNREKISREKEEVESLRKKGF